MNWNLFVVLMASCTCVCGAEWRNFRGNDGTGVADAPLPTKCEAETIAWAAALPGRGVSSPIVVGDQVVVTASSGILQDRLHVLSFDRASGNPRWHRQFWATGRTLTHPTSANAAPTPASDGEHILAFFSSNDLICLRLDGSLQWYRGLAHDYPSAGNDIGMASSPVAAGGVVVCQVENQGDSFVEAVDVEMGTTLWRLDRPRQSNWSSPALIVGNLDLVVLKTGNDVSAYELRTGEMVWRVDGEMGGIPSVVVKGDQVFVPGSNFTVLDVANETASVAWDSSRIRPSNASPVVDENLLYAVNSAGVLGCFNAADGELNWQLRLGGSYWATPILAAGHLYLVNQNGELQIVRVDGQKGEKVDSHELGESVLASPAAADGELYVRSDGLLWKIADR